LSPRRERLVFALLLAAVGFALAWIATSPTFLVNINWDNSAYIGDRAVGKLTWSKDPWDAHFAIAQVYFLGVQLAHPFGGTTVDGFRLTDALFFAGAATLMGLACQRVVQHRALAFTLALAWMTAWVNVYLLLSLEDNILYLVTGAGVIWICVDHVADWRPRHSLATGALAALATLISWQALLYTAPAFYTALVGGPRRRSAGQRALTAALVPAAFFATLTSWCLFLAATSKLKLRLLLHVMFRRPNTLGIHDVTGQKLVHGAGVAMAFGLTHTAVDVPRLPLTVTQLGTLTLATMAALYVVATWWSFRHRDWRPHVLAATLLLFTLVTSPYHDVEYAYLKRFDFWPILVFPLVAIALGRLRSSRQRSIAAAALALVSVAQLTLARRWQREALSHYPNLPSYNVMPHPVPSFYGRDGQSFFAYYRHLRERTPQACRHVFSLFEIWEGYWNFDNPGSLWSELPDHIALGDTAEVRKWRYPPRTLTVEQFRASGLDQPCDWFSDDARRLLGR
jgi:hypothetical protein